MLQRPDLRPYLPRFNEMEISRGKTLGKAKNVNIIRDESLRKCEGMNSGWMEQKRKGKQRLQATALPL